MAVGFNTRCGGTAQQYNLHGIVPPGRLEGLSHAVARAAEGQKRIGRQLVFVRLGNRIGKYSTAVGMVDNSHAWRDFCLAAEMVRSSKR